jgi:hypothetical protein
MTVATHTLFVKKFNPSDPRLGRNVRHDSRSLQYQVEAEKLSSLKSIRHKRYIPILNQGPLGSCVGNASTANLGTGVFWSDPGIQKLLSVTDAEADETYAVGVYSEATSLDPFDGSYPPTDTGTDGLSAAKVLQKRGLISGYQHATSLEATLTALSKQPVIVGTEWRGDMFNPDPQGRIHITGSVEGGHEYILTELDVENGLVWMDNSWSTVWGIGGRAYFTWDDLGSLLSAEGDCTVFTPITEPAPQPTPPSPEPTPTPPSPMPTDPKAEFEAAVKVATDKFLSHYS